MNLRNAPFNVPKFDLLATMLTKDDRVCGTGVARYPARLARNNNNATQPNSISPRPRVHVLLSTSHCVPCDPRTREREQKRGTAEAREIVTDMGKAEHCHCIPTTGRQTRRQTRQTERETRAHAVRRRRHGDLDGHDDTAAVSAGQTSTTSSTNRTRQRQRCQGVSCCLVV